MDFYDTPINPERRKRNHIRQLEAPGYKVTIEPVAACLPRNLTRLAALRRVLPPARLLSDFRIRLSAAPAAGNSGLNAVRPAMTWQAAPAKSPLIRAYAGEAGWSSGCSWLRCNTARRLVRHPQPVSGQRSRSQAHCRSAGR